MKKLIVDKKIKLSTDYLMARIENPQVDLRCEDSTDDIISISVPVEVYFHRPAHCGPHYRSTLGLPFTRLFRRNLGVYNRQNFADREMEEAVGERIRRTRTRSALERIEEETEVPIAEQPQIQIVPPLSELETRDAQNITLLQELSTIDPPNVTVIQPEDIADLPTQKLEVVSQTRKRTSNYEISPKRQRLSGYVSFRKRLQMTAEAVLDLEAEKENIPNTANVQRVTRSRRSQFQVSPEQSLTVMLQEAGLADMPAPRPEEEQPMHREPVEDSRPRKGSESSETQLGSLDRTKVSLGDSDQTTDSKRFIREQWGTEGTMLKILGWLRKEQRPLTVRRLVGGGPVVAGCRALIAAKCFNSILKLKQHGFIVVKKDPETLEIRDIILGPKFDQVQ